MASGSKHVPALDGLRGVAILMVIASHAAQGWPGSLSITQNTASWSPSLALPDWLALPTKSGIHGVTLFFVVSAFTLTLSLARAPRLQAYALRRIARVGPGYWLAGIGYTLWAGLAPRLWAPDGIRLPDLVIAALFGSAWDGRASMAVVPGGWSVSCEVAFYIALPLVLVVVGARVWRAAALAVLAMVATQLLARHAMLRNEWLFPNYVHPFIQAPVFLLGVTAAILVQRVKVPAWPGVAAILLLLTVFVLPFVFIRPWFVLPHLQFAVIASAVVALAYVAPPRFLAARPMVRIGEVSYSMYLLHFAVLTPSLLVAEWGAGSNDLGVLALHLLLTTGASFGLASLTYRYIEQPCIAWAATKSRGYGSSKGVAPAQ